MSEEKIVVEEENETVKEEIANKETNKRGNPEKSKEKETEGLEKSENTEDDKAAEKETEGSKENEDDIAEEKEPEKVEEDSSSYVRLMADFQNYKRRVEKEKSDIHAYANEKIISKLLDVVDNFERALVHTPEEDSKFHDGMEMILEQLKAVMTDAGVEEIEALGQPFDPNFHNAVMMEDLGEDKKDTVIAVMQKGYTLKGRVVRPSMVKVGQ